MDSTYVDWKESGQEGVTDMSFIVFFGDTINMMRAKQITDSVSVWIEQGMTKVLMLPMDSALCIYRHADNTNCTISPLANLSCGDSESCTGLCDKVRQHD